MALWQWSTTPANNASAGLIDWAEGQPPSTVNDSARQMMADVAAWFQTPEWLNYGLTPTFVSATQFTTPDNKTGIYSVGRRVRAFVTAGTIYGTISASAFTSLTTVTVTWDSGALDSGVSEVDVGILNPAASSFPSGISVSLGSVFSKNGVGVTSSGISYAAQGVYLVWNENNTNGFASLVNNQGGGTGGFVFRNITSAGVETGRVSIDGAGNLTAGGNVTSNSDERLKKEWKPLPDDFISRLATIKFGTFTRIKTGSREAGVSAQSLRELLPETVLEDDDGILSVAYANAALVSCAALAQEVMRLRALLEPVK